MLEILLHFFIFLLAFCLSYALLTKTKIFSSAINATIALVIGFYSLFAFFYIKDSLKFLAYVCISFLFIFCVLLVVKGFKAKR